MFQDRLSYLLKFVGKVYLGSLSLRLRDRVTTSQIAVPGLIPSKIGI